jgi:flavin-dependent dehydrogenase
MLRETDVFVIGGGPAGLAAAISARAKGFRVALADGSQPPIDKSCGEGLMPDTLAALGDLGVSVSDSEGYSVRGVRFLGRANEVVATFPLGQGIGLRRVVLHEKLVERASACGVTLLWKTPVAGICDEGVRLASGVVRAKWIIGADGIGSRVRKWAGLDAPMRPDSRFAVRRHYRMSPWSDFMEVYWGDRAQAYVTPVAADEVCVVLISRERGLDFGAVDEEFPKLAARVRLAELTGAERGAISMTQKLKRVYRRQVALIGDASGSVDAITGEGLRLGFRQAVALAEALAAGNLSSYQIAHRRFARRPMLMGHLMLRLDGRPKLREFTLRAMASDARVFPRLLAAHVGEKSEAHLAATGALLGWRFVATSLAIS